MRRPPLLLAAVAAALVLVPVPGVGTPAPAEATTRVSPLHTARFYVERVQPGGSSREARLIAGVPQARWFGDWSATAKVRAQVDRYVDAAVASRSVPVLTLYAIPHRDCGGYSSGGLRTPAAYAAWVDQVARGIAGRQAVVVVEPDAIASAGCLSRAVRKERMAMLAAAVRRLSASPATLVYLDAGHSRWLSPADAAAGLRSAGVGRARGFSLNVSNFGRTAAEEAYGEKVSALVGGKAYVVDTSRNGRGPAPQGPLSWCNPAGRALGVLPTGRTAGAHADAYLWIKRPGQSDGSCGRGEPAAGSWFESYAVGLVRAAGR